MVIGRIGQDREALKQGKRAWCSPEVFQKFVIRKFSLRMRVSGDYICANLQAEIRNDLGRLLALYLLLSLKNRIRSNNMRNRMIVMVVALLAALAFSSDGWA